MEPIYVEGMHGLGDNFHQLAVIRKLCKQYDVWLETSWPSLYDGLPIHCIANGTKLRTQLKNVCIEKNRFIEKNNIPTINRRMKIRYTQEGMFKYGSVVAAMVRQAGLDDKDADFSFKVPSEWIDETDKIIASFNTEKPILFYRPLVVRKEWNNCEKRNPDFSAYAALFRYIREKYFVVSVADLFPDFEWIVGERIEADKEFHNGELGFHALIGMIARSSLVYASPGFAIPVARSLGVPAICVFGGFENSSSFSRGYGPYLGIDPINPCNSIALIKNPVKRIDVNLAKQKIRRFIDALPSKS